MFNKYHLEEAYETGATEQKAIMLEEASKGFDEWYFKNAPKKDDPELFKCFARTHPEFKRKQEAWQAATLSKHKEIKELKQQNEIYRVTLAGLDSLEQSEVSKEIITEALQDAQKLAGGK